LYDGHEELEETEATVSAAALRTTATAMTITRTVTTIPAMDNPIEALPSRLACCGSSTAVLLATTVHAYIPRTRTAAVNNCDERGYGLGTGCIRVIIIIITIITRTIFIVLSS